MTNIDDADDTDDYLLHRWRCPKDDDVAADGDDDGSDDGDSGGGSRRGDDDDGCAKMFQFLPFRVFFNLFSHGSYILQAMGTCTSKVRSKQSTVFSHYHLHDSYVYVCCSWEDWGSNTIAKIKRLEVRFHKVSSPRNLYIELYSRSDIWQTHR